MSLPFPRRFAQAALLLGAAAAPLIGAGTAQAAAHPSQGLGGLTSLDNGSLSAGDLAAANVGGTVNGAAHQATTLAGRTGTRAIRTGLPAADHVVGTIGTTGVPAAQKAAGQLTDAAGRTAGATAESASGSVPGAEDLPATVLPNTGALPTTGGLTEGLPLDGLPLGSLPAL